MHKLSIPVSYTHLATESLEKFKDVDPAAMQGEIDKLNQQLKDKDAEYAAKEADRIDVYKRQPVISVSC